jgi:hypothetical protein
MREAPKFARHLKSACPNRKWACSRKNGRGTVKREAPISARPAAYAASATWLIRPWLQVLPATCYISSCNSIICQQHVSDNLVAT